MKKEIAVLISNAGTGTNLQAIIDGIENGKILGHIRVVMSDTDDAYGLQRAKKHHIQTYILKTKENVTDILKNVHSVDYIALAGWKKIITDDMIDSFPNRILNIHPGLIPDHYDGVIFNPDGTLALWNKGKFTTKAIQNFFDNHVTYAGSTLHFLSKQFDFGPVLERCFEKILLDDTIETLYARLKLKENAMYVDALQKLCAQ